MGNLQMIVPVSCWKADFVSIPKNMIFKNSFKLGIAPLPRLWLSIIYVWVSHLRYCGQKAPQSPSLLWKHIDPTILFSHHSHFPSFLPPAGPDSPNWRELLALLQTVCQLQCRVHGGKFLIVCEWTGIYSSTDELCRLISSLQKSVDVKASVLQEMPSGRTYLLSQPYIMEQTRSTSQGETACMLSFVPTS